MQAAALTFALVVYPGYAFGQVGSSVAGHDPPADRPTWAGDLAFLSGNAALGGLTAGLIQTLRGGSFWGAFRDGALGGAVSYAGRRVASEPFDGAGLVGREVAAVGASLVRNASVGNGPLDELVLPLGIAWLYLRRDTTASKSVHARLKLDVPTILASIYLGFRGDTDLDVSASVSAGAPVFYTRARWVEEGWLGYQAAGAIWLRGNPNDPYPEADEATVFGHERVHVLQYDFSSLTLGDAADRLVTDRLPGGAWIDRHLDLGVHLGAWGLANLLIPRNQRPWEQEAHFLSGVSSYRE